MNTLSDYSVFNSDQLIDQLIGEYDDTSMPLPGIEYEPHLLISKVRKHYMDHIIKLLSINYENNHKLLNKNIYLPSAIWRCAKIIEMKAAQTCMVVQLYRKNIGAVITELKHDTKKGKLNKKLYECLRKPPENEKKLQTAVSDSIQFKDCSCECVCNKRKKHRKTFVSPKTNQGEKTMFESEPVMDCDIPIYKIPVIANLQVNSPKVAVDSYQKASIIPNIKPVNVNQNKPINEKAPNISCNPRMSTVEHHDSDGLTQQLQKLFQCDSQEDDLFEGAFCDNFDTTLRDAVINTQQIQPQGSVIENHAAQIKSLDERLESLVGLLVNNNDNNASLEKNENQKSNNKKKTSKWKCEEYFLKSKLLEILDEIGDGNRKKLARIKQVLTELFGEDSDEEGIMSPLEETPEFIISCKDRIAPWVLKLLTPYYMKGRIRGKNIFKAVAKHLIKLIYQCSRYPHEYEVNSFVSDFLDNHKMIRCEADFKQFKIDNL